MNQRKSLRSCQDDTSKKRCNLEHHGFDIDDHIIDENYFTQDKINNSGEPESSGNNNNHNHGDNNNDNNNDKRGIWFDHENNHMKRNINHNIEVKQGNDKLDHLDELLRKKMIMLIMMMMKVIAIMIMTR